MTILWPFDVLTPQHPTFDIAPRSLSGPPSVSGKSQVTSSDAGIWKASYQEVPVVDAGKILAWRAVANLLEGRLNPILVPVTRFYQPVPDGAEEAGLYAPVPHSDNAWFLDGTGYISQVIDVTLAGSAPLRAVSATINVNVAGLIQPGQHFSIDGRLYLLRSVVYTSETAASITFRPPLREAASAGSRLEFDWPVCRMKLATDGEMDLPLESARWGFPTVNFVEDV